MALEDFVMNILNRCKYRRIYDTGHRANQQQQADKNAGEVPYHYNPVIIKESFSSIRILPLLIIFSKLISPVTVISAFLFINVVSPGNILAKSSLLNLTFMGKA